MIRTILVGSNGRMGSAVAQRIAESEDLKLVAGIDRDNSVLQSYPVYTDIKSCNVNADVMIDFSHPSALMGVLDYAISRKLPLVIATTGMSSADIALIKESSLSIPIFFTFNMSLGVNLLIELAKKAAAVLGDSFNVEIIERHHNQKVDAPSGTAIMIADAVAEVLPYNASYTYDRHSVRKKRSREEIGIHSVRGGTIVGEHDVIFAGPDEVITLTHQSQSREVFATGALAAARFLVEKRAGLYSMKDII